MKISAFIALALMAGVSTAIAGELDPAPSPAPGGIIVRVGDRGATEVYRSGDARVSTEKAAQDAASASVTAENRIQDIKPGTELDRDSSHEAWYRRHAPYYGGYYYSYYYYGSYWNYYP